MARCHTCALVPVTLIQVVCSITVIVLATQQLSSSGRFGDRCFLSASTDSHEPCSLATAAGAVSLSLAALASCLRCASFNCCGLGPVQSVLLSSLNCVWWTIVAAVLTACVAAADGAGVPRAGARHTLLAAAWIAAAGELAHAVVAVLVVGNNVCNVLFCVPELHGAEDDCCASCCGGCCCEQRRRRRHRHTTQALLPPPVVGAAAVAATAAWVQGGWWQRRRAQPQPQVVVVPPGGYLVPPGAPQAGGSYMPPPPMSHGQPYVVAPPQQAPQLHPPAPAAVFVAPGFPATPPMQQPPPQAYAPPLVVPATAPPLPAGEPPEKKA